MASRADHATYRAGDRHTVRAWLADAATTGHAMRFSGCYRDPRSPWTAPLRVRAYPGSADEQVYFARARDISANGIGFVCRTPIPAFAPIHVFLEGSDIGVPATVMHCEQGVTGCLVGAEFCLAPEHHLVRSDAPAPGRPDLTEAPIKSPAPSPSAPAHLRVEQQR